MINQKHVAALLISAAVAFAAPNPVLAATLYVRAQAPAGGIGSRARPFNTLAEVERASGPADLIIVLPEPLEAPPLDGGIRLKPGQKLLGAGPPVVDAKSPLRAAPRITNTSFGTGDAVVLADDTEVANLVISSSRRGAIYGSNVRRAHIRSNDISDANTGCTPGYRVLQMAPNMPLSNGWAAILLDADRATSEVVIEGNRVHDAHCSDGIEIRATGSARVNAQIDGNAISRLRQGPDFLSLIAIGLQTQGAAQISAVSTGNSETEIGSPGANCEGLFTSQTGGAMTWTIERNTFARGIGGQSCNGMEAYVADGAAQLQMTIRNSRFEGNPGDMLEVNNLGVGSVMGVELDRVTVRGTTATDSGAEAAFPQRLSGTSACVSVFVTAPSSKTRLRMTATRLEDCAGDGVYAFADVNNATVLGFRPGLGLASSADQTSVDLDIRQSTINSLRYALHWVNFLKIGDLRIRAEDSQFSVTRQGPAVPATAPVPSAGIVGPRPTVVAFDQRFVDGATVAAVDLGGGRLGSRGGNCFDGPQRYRLVRATNLDVALENNRWAGEPAPSADHLDLTGLGRPRSTTSSARTCGAPADD